MRRKRSRKRGRWNGFPSGEGGWKSKRKTTARENGGSGGKTMKVKEKRREERERDRQDTDAIFTDSTSAALVFPLLRNTRPHKEVSS